MAIYIKPKFVIAVTNEQQVIKHIYNVIVCDMTLYDNMYRYKRSGQFKNGRGFDLSPNMSSWPILEFCFCYKYFAKIEYFSACYKEESHQQYRGSFSTTFSGKTCQAWSSQSPHTHSLTDDDFAEGSVALAKTYCRDPGNESFLWCYTTDPGIPWEPCDIPRCGHGNTPVILMSYSLTNVSKTN